MVGTGFSKPDGSAAVQSPPGERRYLSRRLMPPVQAVELQPRDLILRSLDVARRGRMTLLLAPAGYGKTSVLDLWFQRLKAAGQRVVWLSASENEREPFRFLQMLVLALEAAGVDPGDDARRAMGDGTPAALLDSLLFGLERQHEPLVIIVDDYDHVDHPPITQLVQELIAALSPSVHFVLGARRKPALPIALLRSQGDVRVIEAQELRFSAAEISSMLGDNGLAGELGELQKQTEGWPVALQLYRLWRDGRRAGAPAPPFGGYASEVADYLAEQIFAGLPDELQKLLADLSLFGLVDMGFSDHVRDANDSGRLLEQAVLALPGLIQRSMADGELAYRMHPLIADYARTRLMLEPGRSGLLYRRAAGWMWQHGQYQDAVRLTVQSKDARALSDLLAQLDFLGLFLARGSSELRAILGELPSAVIAETPRLKLLRSLVLFKEGFLLEAEQLRAQVAEAAPAGVSWEREYRALGAMYAVHMLGESSTAEARIAELDAMADPPPYLKGWAENLRLPLQEQSGDLDRMQVSLENARHSYAATDDYRNADLYLEIHSLTLDLARGNYRDARERIGLIERRPPARLVGERCLHAMAKMAAAHVDYQRGYKVNSAETMRIGLFEFGREEAWHVQYATALPVIADAAFRRQGLSAVEAEFTGFRIVLERRGQTSVAPLMAALELLFMARAGELDAPIDVGETACWRTREYRLQANAVRALANNDWEAARVSAEALVADAAGSGRLGGQVKGQVLMSRASELGGMRTEALTSLREAVRLALPEMLIAPFAEEGRAMNALLAALLEWPVSEMERRHLQQIQRSLAAERQLSSPDELTDREAEILAHLADGASNKLIARRLGLTDNTVKFHLKKIFTKLGVSNRKAAVARAAAE
ncbi:hypothetical protein FJQ54_00455 [Sandaracinobacter neustonicus]|uniref:HTH luxR-type domain-containing protein n=1 Tax=Sandaracinobacter neustonicus TaxID=1715348 RepID=A0A501XWI0_9SPHN|nr:LuxR C-terminal-related transcriptional regulator [Sandaracinobacter neustonicus]TPE64951.1 hypothetical protein FJQ54_00455 [Sandaracinobacter neustonicus]